MDNEELQQKMLKVAGFEKVGYVWYINTSGRYYRTPPHFPTDFNACEKWIVPNIPNLSRVLIYPPVAPGDTWLVTIETKLRAGLKLRTSEGNCMATAFCEAVAKMESYEKEIPL